MHPAQAIDKFQSDIASAFRGLQSAAADVQHSVLDRMYQLQADWQPRLDRIDIA